MSISPKYKPLNIVFNRGMISSKDASLIPYNSCSELTNFILDNKGRPTKVEGIQKYNSTVIGTNKAIKGGVTFIGEDNTEYIIVASNNGLYWSNGNGTFTAVKYNTENVAITIDTDNYEYEFIVFPKTVAGNLQWMVYVITNDYPISNTVNGVANKYCTISRALRLEILSSVIIGKNVYYDNDSTRTAGADDVEVGQGSGEAGWPLQGRYPVTIFDRIFIFNYSDGENNYMFSEAQNSEDWTPSISGSNVGGGKNPEEFTGAIAVGSNILAFTRIGILNIQVSPSSPVNWRETWLRTTYGCVSHRAIFMHSDGWIYFLSEQGFCRTDGRIAEKVDIDIEDIIKNLPQLQRRKFAWELTSTTDFNSGTPGNGGKLLDTSSGELKQLPQTTQADFDAGTKTQVSTTEQPNNVVLGRQVNGVLISSSFVSDPSGTLYESRLSQTTERIAQSFVYAPNYWLTFLELYVKRTGTADAGARFWVEIRGDAGGIPNSTLYGQFSVLINNLLTSYQWLNVSFGNNLNLNSNQTYWIYMYVTGTSVAEIYIGRYVDNISGNQAFSTNSGSTWSQYYSYDISVKINGYFYYASGNIISQALDFGVTSSSLGNLPAEITTPSSTGITFQTRTSPDNIDWSAVWTNIGSAGENNGAINSTPQRYLQWKALLTTSDERYTPTLSSVYVGSQWISPVKDIGSTPGVWGILDVEQIKNSQTISYEMNTSADNIAWDGWVSVNDGSIPTNTLRRYFKFRITFNTNLYTQIPYILRITQYYWLGALISNSPCATSYKDRIYLSVQSASGSTNDHCWIGQTKPLPELERLISPYSGELYPHWSKHNFMKANVFLKYRGLLIYGYSSEGYVFYHTGNLNDGSAFSSTLISAAFSVLDVESIWRFLYVYSKSESNFSLYYRTRRGQNNWGAWSSAKTIASAFLVSRSSKITLAGLVSGDYIQFKLETTVTDEQLEIDGMNLYYDTKEIGR